MPRLLPRILRTPSRHRRLIAAFGLALLTAPSLVLPAAAQMSDLKIMAPAAPGGGWDQTARSMQQAIVTTGLARSVQVVNVPARAARSALPKWQCQ